MKRISILLLLLLIISIFTLVNSQESTANSAASKSNTVSTNEFQLLLNNQPYYIKGVLYSPSPAGTSPLWTPPYGDFLTNQYIHLWDRDFPMITAMGGNTIKLSNWNNEADHTELLNTAQKYGLKVLITFTLGNSAQSPIQEEWQRQSLLGTFQWQISKYINHPALLGWIFGAELNSNWNNYLTAFSNAFSCNYNAGWYPGDQQGCYNNPTTVESTWCYQSTSCVYQHLFEFINTAAIYAKQAMGNNAANRAHFIFAGVSDTDLLPHRLSLYQHYAPDIDGWAVQIYRGKNFISTTDNTDFIDQYQQLVSKPLIISEFGIDAYNDQCGIISTSPCYNTHESPPSGYGENQQLQSEWLLSQATILFNKRATLIDSSNGKSVGPVSGAIVYEWSDEWWRDTVNVRGCYGPVAYGRPGFEPGQCEWKAHVDCPFKDLWWQSLCGYPTDSHSTFDGYANSAWFGLNSIQPQPGGEIDKLLPRLAYRELQTLWTSDSNNSIITQYLWLILTITCLTISSIIVIYIYKRWQQRLIELELLGQKLRNSSPFPFPTNRAINNTENQPLLPTTTNNNNNKTKK